MTLEFTFLAASPSVIRNKFKNRIRYRIGTIKGLKRYRYNAIADIMPTALKPTYAYVYIKKNNSPNLSPLTSCILLFLSKLRKKHEQTTHVANCKITKVTCYCKCLQI